MSWLSKATGIHIGGGWGVSKSLNRVYDVATHGAKNLATQTGAFAVNAGTLGLVRPKWSGTKTASKLGRWSGYTGAAVATGWGLSSLFAPSVTAPVVAEQGAVDLTAYDAALAEGAAQGVGVAPVISTGASTGLTGIFSSISGGLKSAAIDLGLYKTLFGPGGSVPTSIDRGVMSIFGGSGGSASPGAGGGSSGGGASGFSMLPIVIIGIVILGAFLLTRKRRLS